jgi:hypothetical protein
MVVFNLRFGRVSGLVLAAYGVVFVGSVLLSARWRGLELTPDGAVVRRNAKRFVAWADVTNVRAGSVLLTRVVVLETVRGRVRSWAPASSPLAPDPDFDAKLAYVREWWWTARAHTTDAPPTWPADRATGWGVPVLAETDGSVAVRR